MKTTILVLAGLATGAPLAAQNYDAVTLRTDTIAPEVQVIHGGPDGNILVVTGPRGVLLVDTQSRAMRARVLAAVQAATRAPVRAIVVTHYHYDHWAANASFRERGAAILAHDATATGMATNSYVSALEWRREAAPEADRPTRTFGSRLTLNDIGTRIELRHLPEAHTGGDAAILVPSANVIHTGDVYEIGAFPFIDVWSGGTLQGMIDAADSILAWSNADTRLVPGHGPVSNAAELRAYRDMLVAMRARIRAAAAAGEPEDSVVASDPAAAWTAGRGARRHADRFVRNLWLGMWRERGAARPVPEPLPPAN